VRCEYLHRQRLYLHAHVHTHTYTHTHTPTGIVKKDAALIADLQSEVSNKQGTSGRGLTQADVATQLKVQADAIAAQALKVCMLVCVCVCVCVCVRVYVCELNIYLQMYVCMHARDSAIESAGRCDCCTGSQGVYAHVCVCVCVCI
jgi:hypothetical protein